MKRALVIKHMADDNPGRLSRLLADDGFAIDILKPYAGESAPALAGYDLLIVLGGAMDVWQEDDHPWLAWEKRLIGEWVGERARPFVGICLGHQLLAESLGGAVARAEQGEIGLHEVRFSPDAGGHWAGDGLCDRVHPVSQWHHAQVTTAPDDAVVLASSPACQVQAMALGDHALGVQFHFEWTVASVAAWPAGWRDEMTRAVGPGAHARFLAELNANATAVDHLAEGIYDNFMAATGLARKPTPIVTA